MKFYSILILLSLSSAAAHGGGIETRPDKIAVAFREALELPDGTLPPEKWDFTQPHSALILKPADAAEIKLKIGDSIIGSELFGTLAGGIETLTGNTNIQIKEASLSTDVKSVKYLGEDSEAVFIQINNTGTVLKIQDSELYKAATLVQKIGVSYENTEWVSVQ